MVKYRIEGNYEYPSIQLARGRCNGTITSKLIPKRNEQEALKGSIAITWYNHEKFKTKLTFDDSLRGMRS